MSGLLAPAAALLGAVCVMTTPNFLDELATLPDEQAKKVLAEMSEADLAALAFDWQTFAREKQLWPGHPRHNCSGCGQGHGDDGSWSVWLTLAGRGGGKTRTGAEQIKQWEREGYRRFAFVAETAADARDVLVEGESGILSVYAPSEAPLYEPSKRRLTWKSGAVATLYSGEKPAQLRGPQHEKAWCDEVAKWRYATETLDQLEMGLRLGDNPQYIATTTPRPIPAIRDMVADPDCHVTVWPTWENAVNLAPKFVARLKRKYGGTRLGRQELEAQILEAIPGAIVNLAMIDAHRARSEWVPCPCKGADKGCRMCEGAGNRLKPVLPQLKRIVVAVDPAATSGENSSDTGIVIAALGIDGHYYVLDDRSCHLPPAGWGARAVDAYGYGDGTLGADAIVGEVNHGGEMVEHVIRTVDAKVAYKEVRASRGKHVRFEPVGALYEQGRVHHVGTFADLEDQVCGFTASGYEGGKSPDRADALVWAITELEEPAGTDYTGLALPTGGTKASRWRIE